MAINVALLLQVLSVCGYGPVDSSLASIIVGQTNAFIQSQNEAAMFLAQLIHESGGFQHRKEHNEGRGHPYPPYYGRGFIQLTWRENYARASRDIYGDERLVHNPNLVSDHPELSMRVSVWYWEVAVRPMGGPRKNRFGLTTKAINPMEGGPENATARRRYQLYRLAAGVLGVRNLASEEW